jgi:hypothetical protein
VTIHREDESIPRTSASQRRPRSAFEDHVLPEPSARDSRHDVGVHARGARQCGRGVGVRAGSVTEDKLRAGVGIPLEGPRPEERDKFHKHITRRTWLRIRSD